MSIGLRCLLVLALLICYFSACANDPIDQSELVPAVKTEGVTPTPTPKQTAAQIELETEWKSKYMQASGDLEYHRRLWTRNGIQDYNFEAVKGGASTTDPWSGSVVVVKVRDGENRSMLMVEPTEGYYQRPAGYEDLDTIDKLFDLLRQELESGKILEARYDETRGYPLSATLTYAFSARRTRSITISKFETVK